MATQAGTLANSGQWLNTSSASSGTFTTTLTGAAGIGTSSGTFTQPQIAPADMGDHLTLVKTGNGEFVLTGANAQKLLMEYFEQAPEMWLRLMALKAEKNAQESKA